MRLISILRPTLFLVVPLALARPALAEELSAPDAALDRRSWAQEVRVLRAAERAELAGLSRTARLAPAGPEHARAQRSLEDAKRAWRRRVLEAQLARVRAAGLVEFAQRIERRIDELDAVQQRRAPLAPAGGEQ